MSPGPGAVHITSSPTHTIFGVRMFMKDLSSFGCGDA
jgi:hypothetical protein